MATYSSNTTIKVTSTTVAFSGTGTLYTAPATTGYAIIQASNTTGSANTFTIGSQTFNIAALSTLTGLYVGPGRSVAGGFAGFNIAGAEFSNTP